MSVAYCYALKMWIMYDMVSALHCTEINWKKEAVSRVPVACDWEAPTASLGVHLLFVLQLLLGHVTKGCPSIGDT